MFVGQNPDSYQVTWLAGHPSLDLQVFGSPAGTANFLEPAGFRSFDLQTQCYVWHCRGSPD